MPVPSLGGCAYLFVVVDDYSHAVYTRPLQLKSEAAEAFKVFKAVGEMESGKKMWEVLTDNARELSQGEMRRICEEAGIKLNTTIPPRMALRNVSSEYSPMRSARCCTTQACPKLSGRRSSIRRHTFETGRLRCSEGAYAIRDGLRCEAGPCALARVRCAMRHHRAEGEVAEVG